MTSDDLLRDTAQYEMHYSSPSNPSAGNSQRTPRNPERLTLLESLNDPEIMQGYRSYRHLENARNGSERVRRPMQTDYWPSQTQNSPPSRNGSPTPPENYFWPLTEPASTSTIVEATAPTPPPFTVTTESAGEITDADVDISMDRLADDLYRDMRRLRPTVSDDEDEDEDDDDDRLDDDFDFNDWIANEVVRDPSRRGIHPYTVRPARRSTPSPITPRLDAAAADGGRESDVTAVAAAPAPAPADGSAAAEPRPNVRKPHAEFFIAKNRSRITVKFDPPV